MMMLRRARRAVYRIWWRHLPWSLPVSRAMAPMLLAFVPILIRESALAGFIAAMGSIACSFWSIWSGFARNHAKTGWFPWKP
jgi:hypothetical protein